MQMSSEKGPPKIMLRLRVDMQKNPVERCHPQIDNHPKTMVSEISLFSHSMWKYFALR